MPVFFARHTGADDSPFSAQSPLTQLLPEMGVNGERDIVFIKSTLPVSSKLTLRISSLRPA